MSDEIEKRTINGRNKPEWIIYCVPDDNPYDNDPTGLLQYFLDDIVNEEAPPEFLQHYKKAIKGFKGKASPAQEKILASVLEKAENMSKAAIVLVVALENVPADNGLAKDLRGRAIFLLEEYRRQRAHVWWLEFFAEFHPDDLAGLLFDAEEFPEPPFPNSGYDPRIHTFYTELRGGLLVMSAE